MANFVKLSKVFKILLLALVVLATVKAYEVVENQNSSENSTENSTENSAENSIEDSYEYSFENSTDYSSTEEESEDDKIIGGTNARRGQYPYQVAILQPSKAMYCGGSILSTRVILTAAHCNGYGTNLKGYFVLAGTVSNKNTGNLGQMRKVTQFRPHKSYKDVGSGFDIAIVTVDRPFQLNNNVMVITLNNRTPTSGTCVATGWGKTVPSDDSSIPEILKTVQLNIVNRSDCMKLWSNLPSNTICAAAPGKGTCQGDSGGPVVVYMGGRPIQSGINSFGGKPCAETQPGVKTDVSKYLQWISQNMRI